MVLDAPGLLTSLPPFRVITLWGMLELVPAIPLVSRRGRRSLTNRRIRCKHCLTSLSLLGRSSLPLTAHGRAVSLAGRWMKHRNPLHDSMALFPCTQSPLSGFQENHFRPRTNTIRAHHYVLKPGQCPLVALRTVPTAPIPQGHVHHTAMRLKLVQLEPVQ